MSNNIHDTNVELIREQVNNLIDECESILKNGEALSNYENHFSIKYKDLISTSNTLYTFTLQQDFKNYDRDAFQQRLNVILNIQSSKISQYDASVTIGEKLARDYIPQCREE
jgi:hypothetical protein